MPKSVVVVGSSNTKVERAILNAVDLEVIITYNGSFRV